jgi:hypothetical protein
MMPVDCLGSLRTLQMPEKGKDSTLPIVAFEDEMMTCHRASSSPQFFSRNNYFYRFAVGNGSKWYQYRKLRSSTRNTK